MDLIHFIFVSTPQMILFSMPGQHVSIKRKLGMRNTSYMTMGTCNPPGIYFPYLQGEKAELDQQISKFFLWNTLFKETHSKLQHMKESKLEHSE